MRRYQKWIKNMFFLVLILGLLFGLASVSRAEVNEEGMYFSLLGVQNSIGGDFNGETAFANKEKTTACLAPEINTDMGFGILIGGYKERIAGEFSYLCSSHETIFYDELYGEIPLDGEVELINFDLKLYIFKSLQAFKPYFLSGLVIPKITIDMGASGGGDAIYKGFGLNLGLGAEIKIRNKIGLEGSAVYRGMKINRIEISGTEWEPEDSFIATGTTYSIRLNYYF